MVALGPDTKQVFPEDRSDPTFNEDAVVEQLLLLQRYIRMNYLFVLLGSVSVSFEHIFESLRFLCQCKTSACPVEKGLHRPSTQWGKWILKGEQFLPN